MKIIESSIKSVMFTTKNNEGRLQLIINKNLDDESLFGILDNVYVKPEFRKQGIASKLINEAIEYAKINKLYKIVLNCSDNNIDLYYKHGFKIHQYNMRKLI